MDVTEIGNWLHPPEFSATGIDIVRSDRAPVTRDLLEDVLNTVLREDDKDAARSQVYDTIHDTAAAIRSGDIPLSKVARPKGMSQPPDAYGSPSQTPMPTYRGAKYANHVFDFEQLTAGDKPKLLYVERVHGEYPSQYPDSFDTKEAGRQVDAVALNNPDKLPDEFDVDMDVMIDKTVRDPLRPILAPLDWSVDDAISGSEQASVLEFM